MKFTISSQGKHLQRLSKTQFLYCPGNNNIELLKKDRYTTLRLLAVKSKKHLDTVNNLFQTAAGLCYS